MRAGVEGGELVDVCLDIQVSGKLVMSVGGVWNRRSSSWVGNANDCKAAVVARLHAGQAAATTWFRGWLVAHMERRRNPPADTEFDENAVIDTNPSNVYSALISGGRRGGKTFWAAVAVAAYAVAIPNSIIWAVSPSRGRDDTKPDEIRRYMIALLAPQWIRRQTVATGWELVNGSSIMLKSAHAGADPDAIKEGQADLVWMNESQKMQKRVYVVARGAISDKGGLVLCCANPPVEAKDQQWVSDFAADTDAGKRASVHIPFDPLDNPFIDRRALWELRREVDERTYKIEVRGMFMPAIDSVAYNWMRRDNERAAPAPTFLPDGSQLPCPRTGLLDVTEQALRVMEIGDGYDDIAGMDFQITPHIGGPVFRLFCRPEDPVTRDTVLMWGVDEIVLEGDELVWCTEARRKGYYPDRLVIVGDGTGEYQHTRRGQREEPPEWHGRGSFDIIKMGGYPNIMRPSPRIKRNNPHVIDRVRALTSMIKTAEGRVRLFLDPDRCPKTCKSIREWPTVHGKPSRTHEAAHLGDGASYPIVRLFPRILRSGNTDPGVPDVAQRVDRPTAEDQAFRGTAPRNRNHGL